MLQPNDFRMKGAELQFKLLMKSVGGRVRAEVEEIKMFASRRQQTGWFNSLGAGFGDSAAFTSTHTDAHSSICCLQTYFVKLYDLAVKLDCLPQLTLLTSWSWC